MLYVHPRQGLVAPMPSKKTAIIISLALLSILRPVGEAANAQSQSSGDPAPPPPELGDVVREFMLPVDDYQAIYWGLGLDSELPIEWITSGFEEHTDGLMRKANVFARAGGKRMFALRREREEIPWSIKAVGSKFGIDRVEIEPHVDCWGTGNSGCKYDVETTLRAGGVQFSELCAFHEISTDYRVYKLSAAAKKDLTAFFMESCGSGGCSTYLSLHYLGQQGVVDRKQCKEFVVRNSYADPKSLVPGRQ